MRDVYSDGADLAAAFTTAYGAGNITFLGDDWFGRQRSDWATVQNIEVNLAGGCAIARASRFPNFRYGPRWPESGHVQEAAGLLTKMTTTAETFLHSEPASSAASVLEARFCWSRGLRSMSAMLRGLFELYQD